MQAMAGPLSGVRPAASAAPSQAAVYSRTARLWIVNAVPGGGAPTGQRPRPPGQSSAPYRPGGRGPGGRGRGRSDFQRGGRGGRGGWSEPQVPMNENIRVPEVRVLAEDKSPLGVMATAEALAEARSLGMDLILVVPDAQPPVCRIMEFSKYNYELEKAQKDARKKQRESVIETKELKLRPATDVHDYQVKVRAAQKFLEKGHRIKLSLQFRGREMEFQQLGREMFGRFLEDCGPEAAMEQAPQMQGRQMSMVLGPKKRELE